MVICGCFHLFSFIYIIIVVVVLLHYIRSTPFLNVFAVTSTPLSVTPVMTPTATSLHPHTPTVRATVTIPAHTSPERGPPRSPLCNEGWRSEESTCLTRWRGFNQSCNILMSSRPCRLPGPFDVCRSLWCVAVPWRPRWSRQTIIELVWRAAGWPLVSHTWRLTPAWRRCYVTDD